VPLDLNTVVAVRPDGAAVQLRRVPESSMKNPKLTGERMEWKKRMMKQITERYRKLTAPIPGIIEYSSSTKAALNLKKAMKKAEPAMTEEQYKTNVERVVSESSQPQQTRKPMMARKPVFGSEYDHYKWCAESQLNGYAIPEQDVKFMSAYETKMDDSERIHWEEFKRLYHVSTKTVNDRR
jgi:hypothetical protein